LEIIAKNDYEADIFVDIWTDFQSRVCIEKIFKWLWETETNEALTTSYCLLILSQYRDIPFVNLQGKSDALGCLLGHTRESLEGYLRWIPFAEASMLKTGLGKLRKKVCFSKKNDLKLFTNSLSIKTPNYLLDNDSEEAISHEKRAAIIKNSLRLMKMQSQVERLASILRKFPKNVIHLINEFLPRRFPSLDQMPASDDLSYPLPLHEFTDYATFSVVEVRLAFTPTPKPYFVISVADKKVGKPDEKIRFRIGKFEFELKEFHTLHIAHLRGRRIVFPYMPDPRKLGKTGQIEKSRRQMETYICDVANRIRFEQQFSNFFLPKETICDSRGYSIPSDVSLDSTIVE